MATDYDITALEVLEYLCRRSMMMFPDGESSDDVFAAIRGICVAIGDVTGEKCLGDLPTFVLLHTPHEDGESWLEAMRRRCSGMGRFPTLDVVKRLIVDWKNSHPTLPEAVRISPKDKHSFDPETFDLMESLFRRPHDFIPNASTLSELLAFLSCHGKIKWPAHGYNAALCEFEHHVCGRFNKSPIYSMYTVLLGAFAGVPFDEARLSIAEMIKTWRASYLAAGYDFA